ncbi:MAG TPA: quinol:electron acceptor oxidoreductase subunit ActD [Nitrospira sp.]|nr:quinol:electron acceptor oxidoreductase subunit ActD [Nitrospira sp.]
MPPPDELELQGLFAPDVDVAALTGRLREAGVRNEQIHVLSPLPLSGRASHRIGPVPLYSVTIGAGLVGIGIGIFFAAGTAVLYPLPTGGKPIVAPPVVGIISYETMMLLAIVVTFLTMLVRIRTTNIKIQSRDLRIDDGRIGVTVRVPRIGPVAGRVRDTMEQGGALDVGLSVIPSDRESSSQSVRHAAALLMPLVLTGLFAACSRDMEEQTSYQAQEAPRRHSPPQSVPRESRAFLSVHADVNKRPAEAGARLFHINCAHCHGTQGQGDGPVAAFLKERPANLKGEEVLAMSEEAIYRVVTDGKDMMPSFRGELSAEERLQVARFVTSLSRASVARRQTEEDR